MNGIYWMASYPKSGNTWLRIFLTNYLSDRDEPASINELHGAGSGFSRHSFDDLLGFESGDLTEDQIDIYRPKFYERLASECNEPLFLKVHDAYGYNTEGKPIFSNKATSGVIYLVRNPMDVVVSFAHHRNKSSGKTIELMGRHDAYLLGNSCGDQLPQKLGSWSDHVISWLDAQDLNIHLVKYEELVNDPISEFTKIVRFAGLNLDGERVKQAVEFSSFDGLREQELEHGFAEKQPTSESFFREGRADSWRQVLSPKEIEQLIRDHGAAMQRLGYIDSAGEIRSWE